MQQFDVLIIFFFYHSFTNYFDIKFGKRAITSIRRLVAPGVVDLLQIFKTFWFENRVV